MRKKTLMAFSALAIGLSGLTGIATTAAAAQETPIPGAIHTGDCGSVGDVVPSLSDAGMSAGQPVGNDDAVPATRFFSTIPSPWKCSAAATMRW